MSTEKTFKEKLLQLSDWMPSIIECVRRDLKNDHLKQDFAFIKAYLGGKNIHKIENEELVEGYLKALKDEEHSERIAEFIAHRWIYRNSEMYQFFEERLSRIDPDFTKIEKIEEKEADKLMEDAVAEFGSLRTYIFALLNAVAFPEPHLAKLALTAHVEKKQAEESFREETEKKTCEELIKAHELEMNRVTDKYEKKLSGFQKKYANDVEMLKKQVAQLQRKLSGV